MPPDPAIILPVPRGQLAQLRIVKVEINKRLTLDVEPIPIRVKPGTNHADLLKLIENTLKGPSEDVTDIVQVLADGREDPITPNELPTILGWSIRLNIKIEIKIKIK